MTLSICPHQKGTTATSASAAVEEETP